LTKAELHASGEVIWSMPTILKSSCMIDVEFFPFDQQHCLIVFSSWTYDSNHLFLTHMKANRDEKFILENGIDITSYIESDEWDIINLPAQLNSEPSNNVKDDFYPNIRFCFILRRKTLFYMVNLITPCISMSFLTVLVFSLSSQSGEKITLCISILLALTLFFLLLLDIMPPTSLVVPLLGKYLVFTITMVSLSICATIYILNIHHRTPELNHEMPKIIRLIFLGFLPPILLIENLDGEEKNFNKFKKERLSNAAMEMTASASSNNHRHKAVTAASDLIMLIDKQMTSMLAAESQNRVIGRELLDKRGELMLLRQRRRLHQKKLRELNRLYQSNGFLVKQNLAYLTEIADFMKRESDCRRVIHEWKLLALVLDRLLLYIFGFAFAFGTLFIFLQAPHIYSTGHMNDEQKIKICQFI
jgi:nicotinic acetylcholine receptor